VDVLDGGGLSGILGPLGIGRADHLAAMQAAAGKGQAEAGGPVVAAAEGVHLRRPAELAAAEYDRPVEQLVARQVAEQGGERRVELLDELAVNLMVVDVGIPAVERHLDAAHACRDELTGGQAAAAESAVAVFGKHAGRFL